MSLYGICVGDRADRPVPDGAGPAGLVPDGAAGVPGPRAEDLAVLEGQGDGGGLEQSVRALMWLRSLGLLRCPVVTVDLGLDREGLAVAQRLALRWPVVDLYRPEDGAEAH